MFQVSNSLLYRWIVSFAILLSALYWTQAGFASDSLTEVNLTVFTNSRLGPPTRASGSKYTLPLPIFHLIAMDSQKNERRIRAVAIDEALWLIASQEFVPHEEFNEISSSRYRKKGEELRRRIFSNDQDVLLIHDGRPYDGKVSAIRYSIVDHRKMVEQNEFIDWMRSHGIVAYSDIFLLFSKTKGQLVDNLQEFYGVVYPDNPGDHMFTYTPAEVDDIDRAMQAMPSREVPQHYIDYLYTYIHNYVLHNFPGGISRQQPGQRDGKSAFIVVEYIPFERFNAGYFYFAPSNTVVAALYGQFGFSLGETLDKHLSAFRERVEWQLKYGIKRPPPPPESDLPQGGWHFVPPK